MVPYLRGLPHVFLILWIFGWAGGQSTISSDAGVSSTLVAGPSRFTPGASSTLQPSPSSLLGGSSFSSSVATVVQPATDSQSASVSPSRTVPTSSQSALSPTFISTESNVDSSAISLGSLDLASSTATAGIISSMSGTTEILTPSPTITVLEISPVTATPALSSEVDLKQTATSVLPSSISSGSISSSRTLTIVPSSPSEMSTQSALTSAMTTNTTVSPQDMVSPSVALVSPTSVAFTAVPFSGVELSSSLGPTETFASSSSVLSFSSSVVLTAAPPNSSSSVPLSVFATASVRPTGSFVSDSVSTPAATAVAMPSSAAFSSSKSFAVTKFSSSDTPLQSAQITPTTISVVNTVPTLSLNETAVPSTQVPPSSVTDTNMTSFLPLSATSVQSTTTLGLLNTVSPGVLPSLEPSSMAVQPTEMLFSSTALPSEITPGLTRSDLSYFAMPTTIITSPSMDMTASSTEVATPVSVSAAASPSFSNVYNLTSTPAAEVLNISSTPSSSLAVISTSGLISNGTTVAPTSDPSPTASASLSTLTLSLPINTTEIPDMVATSSFALNSSPAVTASETSPAPATNQSASFTPVPSPSYNTPSSESTTEIAGLFSTSFAMSELAPSETSVVIPSYVSFTESVMFSLPDLSVLETESLYQTAAPSPALTTVSMLPSVPLTESVGLSLPNTEAVNSLFTTETQGIPTAPLSPMSSSPSLSEEMLSSSVVPTTLDTFEPFSVMSLSELFLLSTTAGTQLPASSLAVPSLQPSILPLTDLDLEFPSMSVTGMIEKQSISPSLLPMSGSASSTLAASPVSTTQLSSSYFEAAVTVQPSQPISDSFDVEILETISIPTFSMSDSEIYMVTSKSEMATSKTESTLPLKPTPSLISKSATDTEIFYSIHLSDIFSLESSLSPFDVSLQPSQSSPSTHLLLQPSSAQTGDMLSLYPLTELSGTASSISSMPSGVTISPEAPMISETVPLSSTETMSRSSSNEVDSFETLSLPPLEDIQTISQTVDSLTQSLLVEEPNPVSHLLSGIFTATDIEAIETVSVTRLPSLLSMPSLSPLEILPATPTVIPLETFSLPFVQQSENISTMQSASSQPSDHFTTFPMSQTAVATLLPSEVVLPTSLPLETLQLTTLQGMETTSLSSHLVSKNTSLISLSTEANLHNASSAEIDFSLISLPTLQLTDFPQFSDVSALSEPLSVPILATRTEIPSFAQPNLTDEISTSFLYQSKTDTLATLESSNLYPSSAKLSVNELTLTPDFVDLETLSLRSFLMTDSLSIPLVQPMSSSVSVSMDSPSPPEISSPAVTLQSETATHPVLKTLLPTSTVSARTPLLQSVSLSTLDTFVSETESYPAFHQTLSLPSIEMLPSDTISSPTLQSTPKVSKDESLSMITMPDVSLNPVDSFSIVPVSTAILATSTLLTMPDISSPLFQLPESLPASTALQSLATPASSLQSSYVVPAVTASLEMSKPVNLQTETVSESLQNLETLSLSPVDLLPSESLQMASTPSVQDLSAFPSSETLSSGTNPSETVRAISSLSVQNLTAFPSPGTLSLVSVQPTKSVQTTSMPSLQDFTLLPGLETMSLADVQFSETLQMTSSPLQMTTAFNASVILQSQTIQPAISETFSVLPTLSVSDVGMPTPSFDILETLNVTESVLDTASFLSLLDMQTFPSSVQDLSMTPTVTETPSLLLNMSSVTLAPSTPDFTLLSLYDQSSLMSEVVSINFTEFLLPSDSLVDLITPSSPSVELSKTPSMSTNGSVLILPSQTIISSPLASPSPVTFSESVLSYTPTLAALETLAVSRNMTSDMGTESASFNMGLPSLSELLQPSTQLSVIATTQPMKTEMISSTPQSEALLLPSSGVTVPVVSETSATLGPSLPGGTSLVVGTPAATSAVTAEMSSLGTMLQYETTSAQVFDDLFFSLSSLHVTETTPLMLPPGQGSPSSLSPSFPETLNMLRVTSSQSIVHRPSGLLSSLSSNTAHPNMPSLLPSINELPSLMTDGLNQNASGSVLVPSVLPSVNVNVSLHALTSMLQRTKDIQVFTEFQPQTVPLATSVITQTKVSSLQLQPRQSATEIAGKGSTLQDSFTTTKSSSLPTLESYSAYNPSPVFSTSTVLPFLIAKLPIVEPTTMATRPETMNTPYPSEDFSSSFTLRQLPTFLPYLPTSLELSVSNIVSKLPSPTTTQTLLSASLDISHPTTTSVYMEATFLPLQLLSASQETLFFQTTSDTTISTQDLLQTMTSSSTTPLSPSHLSRKLSSSSQHFTVTHSRPVLTTSKSFNMQSPTHTTPVATSSPTYDLESTQQVVETLEDLQPTEATITLNLDYFSSLENVIPSETGPKVVSSSIEFNLHLSETELLSTKSTETTSIQTFYTSQMLPKTSSYFKMQFTEAYYSEHLSKPSPRPLFSSETLSGLLPLPTTLENILETDPSFFMSEMFPFESPTSADHPQTLQVTEQTNIFTSKQNQPLAPSMSEFSSVPSVLQQLKVQPTESLLSLTTQLLLLSPEIISLPDTLETSPMHLTTTLTGTALRQPFDTVSFQPVSDLPKTLQLSETVLSTLEEQRTHSPVLTGTPSAISSAFLQVPSSDIEVTATVLPEAMVTSTLILKYKTSHTNTHQHIPSSISALPVHLSSSQLLFMLVHVPSSPLASLSVKLSASSVPQPVLSVAPLSAETTAPFPTGPSLDLLVSSSLSLSRLDLLPSLSLQVLQTLDVSMSYVFSELAADMTPTSQLIGSPSVTLGPSGSAETSVLLSPTLQSSSSSFILMSNDDFEGSGSDLPFLSQTIPMLTQTASATSVSATSVPATSLQLSPSPSYSVDSFSSVVPSSVMSRSSLQLTPMPSFSQDLASFSLAPTAADTLGSSVPSATTTQTVVITPSLQPSPSQSYIIDSFSSSGPSSSLQPSLTPSYTPGLASFSLPLLSTVSLPVLESSPGFDGSGDGPATDLFFSSSPSLSTSSQTPSISLDFFTPSTALGTTIQPTASISAPNDTSVMTSFTLEAASSVEPLTPLTVSVFSSIEATLTPEGSGDMETSQFLQLESTPSISLSSIPTSISTASFGFSIPVTAFSSISEIVPTPSFSMDFPASTAFFESTQQFEGSGMSISEAFSETVSFTLAASFDSLSSTPAIPTMVSSQVGTATQALSPSLQETVTPSMEDISLPPFTMMSSMFLESTSLVLVIPSSTVDQETVTPSSSMEDVSLPPFTMVSSMFLESTSLVLLPSFTVDLLPSMSTEAASSSAGSVLVSSTTSVMSSAASVASQPSMVGISSSAVQPTSSIAASSSQSATPTPALPTTALISASPLVSSGSAVASSVVPTSATVASSSLLSSTAVEPSLTPIPSMIIAPSFTAVVVSSSSAVVSSSAGPTTQAPTTQAPTSQLPTTQAPTSQVPTTQPPTTQPPTTQPPTTQPPTTQATSTPAPTTPGPAATTFSYVTANLSVELVLTWVNTVLVIPDTVDITIVQFYFTMEARLARAFAKARQRKAGMDVARNPILRRKRAATFENVTCQVINATRDNSTGRNDHVTLTYYVMYEGQAVPASQAVADLALLDEQEVALQLGYFVAQTEEYVPVTAPSDPMYWIIAAVLGPLFIIIVIWLVCCCKRTKSTEMAPDTVGELQKKGTPRGIAPAEMQKKVMTDTLIPPGSYVVKVPAESRDAPPLPARRGQPQPRRSAKTKDRRQKSSKRRHSKRRSTEESEDSSFTSVTDRSSKPRSKKSPEYMLESDTGDSFASDAGSKAGLFEHVAKLSAVIEPTPQKPASRAFHSSVHPIKFPPLRTPLVTDRLRESIKENQQLSQSMRQKADIEHWRNKQLQRERSLRRKPSSPRGGYEHTAVGDTKDQRRAYKRAQQQIDSVLEPGSQIPAVLEPSRRRRMKRPHKRHGSHDIQGVTSPHDPELAMQFGQQPQGVYRPINGVPPLGPQPPMPVDSEGRSFEDESYTESDPETMPISQARERIHQLLDEAFSLISPSVPPRNTVAPAPNVTTVQPVQSTPQYAQPAGNGQVPNGMGATYMTPQAAYPQDLRTPQGPVPPPAHGRASTAGPRARRRFNGQSASSSDREPTADQPLFTRQPTVVFSPEQYQQAAAGRAAAPDPRARTSQATPASVNMGTPQQPLFVTPVQQKTDGSGSVLWSLYNAEDEVSRMSQSREPASLPGGLDASPLLSRLQSTPMTRTSSLPSVTPPHLTPSQTTTFPAPSPIGQTGYGSPFIGQPGTSPGSHPGMRTLGQSAFTPVRSSPGSDQSGAGSNPPSQLDDSRLRPGQDPDADEVDIMSGIRTGDSAQPLIQAIKEELKRLSGKTPVTTL